ncbi:type I polyketide synthase [Nocardia stercoris]|uniref:SDR family NAD(P)-dependent oxidoreductase n=1 Tax=Nocardia stercoris TaxID=2483361 RepID=A0A3M2LBS1_9NOCA|nr:type I polyketide synthase [Nocardia stercoris]RMI33405.1 SDR family NAD(P)-dependent oxidoreductase [Nocardia stercoris]
MAAVQWSHYCPERVLVRRRMGERAMPGDGSAVHSATLVDTIESRAERTPDRMAMRFVRPTAANRFETEDFTYREIAEKARSIAVHLGEQCAPGSRILLLCPPGLEYTLHFYGCLYAGLIPVPAYPPASNRHLSRVETIARSARAAAVLTAEGADRFDLSSIRGAEIPTLAGATWIEAKRSSFDTPSDSWRRPEITGDTTALLQYTSGSTSAPKGVVVSHANLLDNARLAADTFGLTPDSRGAGWLPPYHDMGLLGGLVSPIHTGYPIVVISPMTFIRDPLYWLEVISRERATSSAGPNFAYQMCVDKATPERLAEFDLSTWNYALNGSEPVRAEVLDTFSDTFAECGFRRSAFYPCYGLAEATLLVSGGRSSGDPTILRVGTEQLAHGQVVTGSEGPQQSLVSSGKVAPDTEVVIVDPATSAVLPEGAVGEVWMRGSSITAGYFENESATTETFRRFTADGSGPYLNPGDLGVMVDQELYIVGRTKEAMNFRGRNVYPQDVEATAVASHPGLAGTRCISFSIEVDGADQLVVVQQKPRRASREHADADIVRAVRRAVSDHHQLSAYDVLLVPARAIPVTSSGKLQRAECRKSYLDGEYGGRIVSQSETNSAVPQEQSSEVADTRPVAQRRREIEDLLVTLICRHAGLTAGEVDRHEQFATYGLSSIQAVRIAADLSDELGTEIAPTLAWEYPSIDAAAAALAGATDPAAATEFTSATEEPIAVVGVGCRLPGGVTGPDSFWDLLVAGRSGIAEVPGDRWDADGLFDADPDAPGKTYSRHGGFLDDVRGFDAGVFGVSAREATTMDPQHRAVLEVAWEALEHAGIAPDSLRGSATGVFVGMSGGDYERIAAAAHGIADIDAYVATGNAGNFGANRLSYALGLQGPSLVVDTACSSSLVAVHLAVQSLRAGESDLALAGGVNLQLSPEVTVALAKGRMLSATGQCHTFDAAADGYVRGEGCGVVVLRRLSDALAAGDHILSVIRGSAVNQDGRSSGLTAPSMTAQQDVVRRALAVARVAPAEIGYVEAHGTGTPLGDPIEVRALAGVLGTDRPADRPLRLGSVKTNIGHLEAAAGIAGFIKAALVLSRGVIPPHLNLRELSPHIAWDRMPVQVPRTLTVWGEGPRLAGVSSFGFGGTNAHIVLGAAPEPAAAPADTADTRPALVKVSGADAAGVAATAARLAEFVAAQAQWQAGAVAWAAGTGRADLPSRATVLAGSRTELLAGLRALAAGTGIRERRHAGARPRVAFLAPGHGARITGVLAGVYGTVPVVTDVLDSLGPMTELPLSVLVETGPDAESAVLRTEVAQPALYALAVALGSWWRSVGVEPELIAGHSVGAYAAAALSGAFSIGTGAELIRARANAMSALPDGTGMAAIGCAATDLADLPESVSVAAVNGPSDTVVAGPDAEVDAVVATALARGLKAKRLSVNRAFHTAAVDPALDTLRAAFAAAELTTPTTEFISDTTGAVVSAEVTDPEYWVDHTRQPVRFGDVIDTALSRGITTVVELGPGALLPLVQNRPGDHETLCVASVSATDPARALTEAAGRLWRNGTDLDWTALTTRPARVPILPTYAFQHVPYWITDGPVRPAITAGSPAATASRSETGSRHSALGAPAARTVDEEIRNLRGHIARLLELPDPDRIDPDTGLFELGLTSAMAVELITVLRETHSVPLPATVVFEHSTIAKLAAYLSRGGAGTGPATRSRAAAPAEPIAIVGMACRFPGGANDPAGFWRLLRDGVDGTGPIPADRAALRAGLGDFRGGFLDLPVAGFDPDVFGISPREARSMDPQQRLLLEVVWEALDDAGIPRDHLDGVAGSVHVGMNTTDYLQLLAADGTAQVDPYFATGNTFSVAAGRVSYLLGLRGPATAIDTACSSSLVATDHAIRDLRSGVSDVAIVGGVNLILSPATVLSLSSMGALAADGRCKTFDAAADGYGRGEGCGVLVLKRQSDAERDGDRTWALIRGSAVNQDGRSAGLTVPSGTAQAEVIADALHAAGVTADAVGYVEAHGTGTPLGDPIELAALASVLRPHDDAEPLIVGSAKSNVGHLEAAAGVCGLIKVALSLHHKMIPPNLHYGTPNPRVPWEQTPITVPTAATAWPEHGAGRIAGISSFGFSGTNAHVVLQEAPAPAPAAAVETELPQLITVSAASPAALRATAAALAGRARAEAISTADLAATLLRHRTPQPFRHGFVATATTDLLTGLDALATTAADAPRTTARTRAGLVFVYSGQGSQWAGLGERLLGEPLLRAALTECDDLVRAEAGWSLLTELQRAQAESRLEHTRIAQPVITALQIALTDLWASWGIRPGAVIGHSIGEIAAGYAAGVLSRRDALRLAIGRGAAMDDLHGQGVMAAVGLPETHVRELVEDQRATGGDGGGLCVAAVNGPAAVVISGAADAVDAVLSAAAARGARTRIIQQRYAFHSSQVESARAALADVLDRVELHRPAVPFHSTVTGATADTELTTPAYWLAGAVQPVRFLAALRAAAAAGAHRAVEIGPDRSLAGAILQSQDEAPLRYLPSMTQDRSVRESVLAAAGALLDDGYPVVPAAIVPDHTYRRVALPAYPWQRQEYWLPGAGAMTTAESTGPQPLSDLYGITWEASESRPEPVPEPGTWVIVAAAAGPAGDLADRLQADGHGALIVDPEFAATADRARWDAAIAAVRPAGAGNAVGVVYVAAGTENASGTPDLVAAEVETTTATLLTVAQAWIASGRIGRIYAVTRGAAPVGDEPVTLAHTPLWGLGRVVGLEHPGLWGGVIDLDPRHTDPVADATRIAAEITAADVEDQVAYRDDRRLVPRLHNLDEVYPATPELRSDAAYLITGGRGSLGVRLAGWLARRGARHLILLGRSPLADAAAQTREAVAALRESGVTVYTPDADVADHAAMSALFEDPAWPPVRGVVHAAGTLDAATVADMPVDQFHRVLHAKVRGGLVLDALPALAEVDFFVLFSSAAAVWGSALAAHYCAANHFLDMLAWDRRARRAPALAVDWGWWQDSAMAAGHGDYFASMGMAELAADTALEVLDATLTGELTQVVAAPVDWRRFLPVMEAKRRRPLLSGMAAASADALRTAAADRFVDRVRTAAPAARDRLLRDAVQREVAVVLGLDPQVRLDPQRGFFESGMDSITSVELKGRIEALLGRTVPVTTVFEHPTIAGLSAHLLELLAFDDTGVPTAATESAATDTELADLSELELLQLLDRELNSGRIDDRH